jgi:hypothetical protein
MDTGRPGPLLLSLVSLLLLTLVACAGESSSGVVEAEDAGRGGTSLAPALDNGSATQSPSEVGRTEGLVGQWVLEGGSADGQVVPSEPELVLRVEADRFYFPLACNSASVPYQVNDTSIEFDIDGFATTEEGCTSVQADLFELALLHTRSFSADSSQKTLTLVGPDVRLRFDRQSP